MGIEERWVCNPAPLFPTPAMPLTVKSRPQGLSPCIQPTLSCCSVDLHVCIFVLRSTLRRADWGKKCTQPLGCRPWAAWEVFPGLSGLEYRLCLERRASGSLLLCRVRCAESGVEGAEEATVRGRQVRLLGAEDWYGLLMATFPGHFMVNSLISNPPQFLCRIS